MELQIIWKMFPVLMGTLWIMATLRFQFIQRGQINAWLGITAIALQSNLVFYGNIELANIISAIFVLCMIMRSMSDAKVTFKESLLYKAYSRVIAIINLKRQK